MLTDTARFPGKRDGHEARVIYVELSFDLIQRIALATGRLLAGGPAFQIIGNRLSGLTTVVMIVVAAWESVSRRASPQAGQVSAE
ncbi:hypothetical protein [Paraburkholderia sp. BL10I2N1]|uniref:hypothetical protein n=1 Tax=Paraburkholderia sp. BL10I2N1 TaxID=1938796 RepID=UPI0010611F2B|nr:hypothetical protein [Paraburkholderia sp. BL10I2N1]TDN70584.1 hypothetical protein B0G77_4068 [Paraburkholderia sp. BL10I2N1]